MSGRASGAQKKSKLVSKVFLRVQKCDPQRLKAVFFESLSGRAEAVPFPKPIFEASSIRYLVAGTCSAMPAEASSTGGWLINSQYKPTFLTVSRNWSKSTGFWM
jgi:hypothetical protein